MLTFLRRFGAYPPPCDHQGTWLRQFHRRHQGGYGCVFCCCCCWCHLRRVLLSKVTQKGVCCWGGGVWLCCCLHGELLSVMMSVNKTPDMQLHRMFRLFLVGRNYYFNFTNTNMYMHISCGQPMVVRPQGTHITWNGVVFLWLGDNSPAWLAQVQERVNLNK